MGRRCTAGGFAVIPEQARQYEPFKVFFALEGTYAVLGHLKARDIYYSFIIKCFLFLLTAI